MSIETITMSSKGQIVIPQSIREEIGAEEGTLFAAIGGRDTVLLKKLSTPSREELLNDLHTIAIEGRKRLEKKNIKEGDIPRIVEERRKRQ